MGHGKHGLEESVEKPYEKDGYVTIPGVAQTYVVFGDTKGRSFTGKIAGSLELVGYDGRYNHAMHVWLSERGLVRMRKAIDKIIKNRRVRAKTRSRKRNTKTTKTTKQERLVIELYLKGMPCHAICARVFPSYQPEMPHLRTSKVIRILKRLQVKLRTPGERRAVGNAAFVVGMKARTQR